MKAWEEYAYISDGKVKNVGVFPINGAGYTLSNMLAKETYGNDAFAVNVTQIPVFEGDEYIDGEFYRVITQDPEFKVKVDEVPTDEQKIEELSATVDQILIGMLGGN